MEEKAQRKNLKDFPPVLLIDALGFSNNRISLEYFPKAEG